MKLRAIPEFNNERSRVPSTVFILIVAACMVAAGVSRGEVAVVFNKAVNICMECIGLG